jgi:hypothetical protein
MCDVGMKEQLVDQSKGKDEEVASLHTRHEKEMEELRQSYSAKVEEFTRVIEDLQSTLEGASQQRESQGVALDLEAAVSANPIPCRRTDRVELIASQSPLIVCVK